MQFKGFIDGYPDGTFRPDQRINRAEFTKILIGATHTDDFSYCNTHAIGFSDVEGDAWFAPYVCAAKRTQIVDGYPDGSFRPDAFITFVEAAKMLARAFELQTAPDAVWYRPFGRLLGERNAIPSSIAQLDQQITRGEMAEMVYRIAAGVVVRDYTPYSILDPFAPESGTSAEHRMTLLQEIPAEYMDCYQKECFDKKHFPAVSFRPFGGEVSYVLADPVITEEGIISSTPWTMMLNDKAVGMYEQLQNGSGLAAYSADGTQHAYAAFDGQDYFVVHNGREGKKYHLEKKPPSQTTRRIWPFFLSNNTLVYSIEDTGDTGPIVVLGNKELALQKGDELRHRLQEGTDTAQFLLHTRVSRQTLIDLACEQRLSEAECSVLRERCTEENSCEDFSVKREGRDNPIQIIHFLKPLASQILVGV